MSRSAAFRSRRAFFRRWTKRFAPEGPSAPPGSPGSAPRRSAAAARRSRPLPTSNCAPDRGLLASRISPGPMRIVVRSAVLIAFSVACGYAKLLLFPFLFFVELYSVAVFLSGTLVGVAWGAWVGAASRIAFSLANPYGPPHPWVLLAQILGAAWIGALGGLVGPRLLGKGGRPAARPKERTILLLGSGFLA